LKALHQRLAAAPRRRDFKTVPRSSNARTTGTTKRIAELLAYRGGPKQLWDNKDRRRPLAST
jgi:hypothetical protein